jgi:hypothetical protein
MFADGEIPYQRSRLERRCEVLLFLIVVCDLLVRLVWWLLQLPFRVVAHFYRQWLHSSPRQA